MKIRNQMLSSIIVIVLLCQMPIAQAAQDRVEAFPPVSSIEIEDLTDKTHDEKNNLFVTKLHHQEDESGLRYRQWPMEGLLWLMELEAAYGLDVIPVKYERPTEEDLSTEQVVEIAKKEVSLAFQWDMSNLNPFEVSFFRFSLGSEYYWYVSFHEGGYVLLSREGDVTSDVEHSKLTPKEQYERDGAILTVELATEQYSNVYFMWPLETQALLPHLTMPSPEHIQQPVAAELAIEALREKTGMAETMIKEQYIMYPSFNKPEPWFYRWCYTWCFTFYKAADDVYYMVYVNAETGEIVEITISDIDAKG